jgi:hypothetical protein
MFDVNLKDSKCHPKVKVICIELGGKAKAYAFLELSRTRFASKICFQQNSNTNSLRSKNSNGSY